MMDFGDALKAIRDGYVVRRAGWEGRVLGITCFPPLEDGRLTEVFADGTYSPFKGANGDLLALDWELVGQYPLPERQVPLCPDCLQPAPDAVTVMRLEMTA